MLLAPLSLAAAAARNAQTHEGALASSMLTVPAGSFQMGDSSPGGFSDQKPAHTVAVRAFRLSRFEVSFDQYDAFAKATGRRLPSDKTWGRGTRPVMNVTWDDAQAFIRWINSSTAQHYRLPTEAEWEYAARAGTSTVYPWGDEWDSDKARGDGAKGTVAVDSYAANAWGFHNMIGNVWEWVQDCYHDNYEGAPADGSAWASSGCAGHVYRGGSWIGGAGVRSSSREWAPPTVRASDIGFRLAQNL
jgi:formylglycine-generating enzyme required for sulfatase activity